MDKRNRCKERLRQVRSSGFALAKGLIRGLECRYPDPSQANQCCQTITSAKDLGCEDCSGYIRRLGTGSRNPCRQEELCLCIGSCEGLLLFVYRPNERHADRCLVSPKATWTSQLRGGRVTSRFSGMWKEWDGKALI